MLQKAKASHEFHEFMCFIIREIRGLYFCLKQNSHGPLFNPQRDLLKVPVPGGIADHDFKLAGLHDIFHVDIVESKMLGGNLEGNRRGLPGLQSDAAKTFQFLYRPRDGAYLVANVHLNDFISLDLTGVSDLHPHSGGFVFANNPFCQLRFAEFESGIAQAEAEWIKRADIVKKIAAARSRLVIVVSRKMSDRPRDGNRKLASGIYVSEENFRYGLACFLAEVPALEDGLRLFRRLRIEIGRPLKRSATIGFPVAAMASISSS
jgi:hypothetical protein